MHDTTPELLAELVAIHRLTATEAMIATTRRAQARDERVERELAGNAEKAEERLRSLDAEIRRLGGVPDALGEAAGRLAANAKAVFEQALPLDEALFGDLALEHQLHDRAIYAKVLANTGGDRHLEQLLAHVELAHAATIAWLHTRLGELALGGPVAIRPTPVQAVLGALRNAALLPSRFVAGRLNASLDSAAKLPGKVQERAGAASSKATELAEAAGEVLTASRDAGLQQAEREARAQGRTDVAEDVHDARAELGALKASELPIARFDELNAPTAANRVRNLQDPDQLRAVLAYEQANKGRTTIVQAATDRIEELAASLAAAN